MSDATQAGAAMAGHPLLEAGLLDGCTVLEADAGTGKTWTICRLVVRALIERDLDIDRIAVLTFTNAAAAELRQRIAALIDGLLGNGGADDPFFAIYAWPTPVEQWQARLRLARLSLDGAMIGTIHGYCQRVLGEHALSFGRWDDIEPSADDLLALDRVVTIWWRDLLDDPDPRLLWLVGGSGLRRLPLRAVLRRLVADPGVAVWPQPAPGDWRALADELRQARDELGQYIAREREALIQWHSVSKCLNRRSLTAPRLKQHLDEIGHWLQTLPASLDGPRPDGLEKLSPRHLSLKALSGEDGWREMRGFGFFAALERMNSALARRLMLAATVATSIVSEVREALAGHQRQAGILPFDALLTVLADALADGRHGEHFARRLRERYPIAFVDEFQDTDPVQWRIFARVYAPALADPAASAAPPDPDARCSLVLVGDPKQAIYGFRNADVHTYLAAAGRAHRRLRLARNQRASPPLVAALNAIIDGPRPFLLPGIDYPGALPADPPPVHGELPADGRLPLTLIRVTGGDDDAPGSANEVRRRVILATAAEIAALLAREHAPRAAEIAVLVRSARQGADIKRALGELGIGAVEISRESVFASPSAQELHRLLAALAQRDDPAVLQGGALTTLLAVDSGEPASDTDWIDDLAACARSWLRDGPALALHRLLFARRRRAGPLAAQPAGERLLTDLLHLIDLLTDAEPARQGPGQAARWLASQIAQAREGTAQAPEASALRLESDEALVRIQTIHTSKGLEYRVVFLPFMWGERAPPVRADSVEVFSAPMGASRARWLVQGLSGERRAALSHLQPFDIQRPGDPSDVEAIATQLEREALAERLRLGYVALTRAAQRIYLAVDPMLGVYGRTTRPQHGTLAHWLLRIPCADDGLPAAPDPTAFDAALTALVEAGHAGMLDWREMLAGPVTGPAPAGGTRPTAPVGGPGAPAGDGQSALRLAEPRRLILPAWTRRSFTGLMRASELEESRLAGPDHDQFVPSPVSEDPRPEGGEAAAGRLPPLPEAPDTRDAGDAGDAGDSAADFYDPSIRARFARGAGAGVCLHAILEHHDFRRPLVDADIEPLLLAHGFEQAQAGALGVWLNQVLAHDLRPAGLPFRLSDLAPAETMRELPFLIGAQGVDDDRMRAAVAEHLPFDPIPLGDRWTGFLNGYIDVLARAAGRYWLLDWKSNWLGELPHDYGQAELEGAMREHGYGLQIALYALAVHRWLRARLAGYDYERDFGGVAYLFLRGMADPRAPDSRAGVYSVRPAAALIESLDRLFGGGSAPLTTAGASKAGQENGHA
ncbi:MAG: UvrD-helicase domain-containing protein [Burkholderiaceae bacterium]